jgi:hypothetical protein
MKLSGFSKTQIALGLWLVFSIPFVAYMAYSFVRISIMQASYQAGQADTITRLIQTVKKECKAVPIYADSEQVEIVDVSCLKQANTTGSGVSSEKPQTK